MNIKNFLIVFILLFFNDLLSQDSLSIPEVTIHSFRLPKIKDLNLSHTTSRLSHSNISILPAYDFNSIASYLPGVELAQRGPISAQGDLLIQGGTFDQSLLMINGFKMNDIQTGHHQLNLPIPVLAIRSMTLRRGTNSRRYGVGALTGALNIEVSPLDSNLGWAQIHAGSGLNQNENLQLYSNQGATLGYNFGNMAHRFHASMAYDNSNGYRYQSDLERMAMLLMSKHRFDNHSNLSLMASGMTQNFGANSFYAFPFDSNSREKIHTAMLGGTYQTIFYGIQTTVRSYYRYHRDNYILRQSQPNFYQNTHYGQVFGAEIHGSKANRYGIIGAGIDYRYEVIESNNLGNHIRRNLGAFLEQEINISSRFMFDFGAYLNYNSDFGTRVFPGVEFRYKPDSKTQFSLSSEWGMRNPTFTDLYYSDRANIGNPNLVSENGNTHSLGLKTHFSHFVLSTSAFYRRIENMITWLDTDPTSLRKWQPQNNRLIETYGILTQIEIPKLYIGKSNFQFNSSYQYIEFIQNLDGSKYSIKALRHQLISSIVYSLTNPSLSFSMLARYNSHIDKRSYWVLDAKIQYDFKRFYSFVNANNITHTDYYHFENIPMPGRWYSVGIGLRF